jgi:hypothetical protein
MRKRKPVFRPHPALSRDSLVGQRTVFSVCVHGFDLFVDGGFETVRGFEGLVGEAMAFLGFSFGVRCRSVPGHIWPPIPASANADAL